MKIRQKVLPFGNAKLFVCYHLVAHGAIYSCNLFINKAERNGTKLAKAGYLLFF
jgi:hypothetical protein